MKKVKTHHAPPGNGLMTACGERIDFEIVGKEFIYDLNWSITKEKVTCAKCLKKL